MSEPLTDSLDSGILDVLRRIEIRFACAEAYDIMTRATQFSSVRADCQCG